jgi:hypothetical protein
VNDVFSLYDSVRIKVGNIPGVIVAIDTDGGTKPPIYFVEKHDSYKDGQTDLVWCDADELEK